MISEHTNSALLPSTLSTITAAQQLGGGIDILVAGKQCEAAAKKASSITGVSKVLHADHELYEHSLPEFLAPLIAQTQKTNTYSHILAPATSFGKNLIPRIAGILNVSAVSDIIKINGQDTFVRPIYAGNFLSTVKSTESVKLITVRTTAFDRAAEGGSATVEKIDHVDVGKLTL